MYLNFFENTEKVKPTQISTTLQSMSKNFHLLLKEGAASQNENFSIP